MQSNPISEHGGLNSFHMRLRNVHLNENGRVDSKDTRNGFLRKDEKWIRTMACNCCTLAAAKKRHWQKRLSKVKTLRTHRQGT